MRLRLPHTFSIIFSLIIIMSLLTWILPTGEFDRKFDEKSGREIVISDTYKPVESNPQGVVNTFAAFSKGIIDAAEIIAYVLIIGGAYGVILKTGAIDNGLKRVIKLLKGREVLLIPALMILFSIGGTMTGLYEETLSFYLIIIPLMIAAGYDSVVGVAVILIGAGTGFTASIANPFATGIASQIAQIPITEGMVPRIIFYFLSLLIAVLYVLWYATRIKKDPSKSIVYSLREDHKKHFSRLSDDSNNTHFSLSHKLIISIFLGMMIFMMYSVVALGWWIPEMTMIFIVGAILSAILAKFSEEEFWESFIKGSGDLLYAALIIGIARGVVIVAQEGLIIDTILYNIVNLLSGLSKGTFIIINELVQLVIAFLVPSSSGQAALTMPVMVPLADIFEIPRSTVITAYQVSSGLINQFAPTAGVVMAALGIARITWAHWLKFVMPLLGMQLTLALVMLVMIA